jgi:glycosyltransferase involved in cell wall biosynthesis
VIYWIYDFQHIFLPEYFTEDESQNRNKQFALLAENANEIVVSSEDAASHFKKLYPESKSELHVLHFASMIPDFEPINFVSLKEKFLLSERPFFLISNQFWQHKNHRVVFEAIKLLQATSEGFQFDFIFTGKEQDDRNPNYVPDLKKYIAEERLSNIKMLGFIGRDEQLSLMSYAQAVIQPSKFEGWGTVVEDAKMLGVPVILSDLQVHKEQLGEDGLYFERDSAESLVGAIKLLLSSNQNCLDISKEQILSGFRRELQHIFLES